MKKIIVTGNVGRDPESRYDGNGAMFVTFSLAVNTGTKANPRTDWLDISCNGKTAELVQTYVKKGKKVLIEGVPVASAYINKEGNAVAVLRVYANNIEFLSSSERGEDVPGVADYDQAGNEGFNAPADQEPQGFNAPGPSLKSDDIPF